jgi:hypothetical protein
MSDPIIYVDTSIVREGKLAELKAAIHELSAFVEANETRIISYGVYLNEDESRMKIVHAHPDSASLETHMQVGGPVFARFKDLIQLSAIDIFGKLSDHLLKQLFEKARTLGTGTVTVHGLVAGFARFGAG